MTWTSTLAVSLASSAIVAAPLLFRLSAVNAKASLYKAWWERDSARMIIAEAQVDLTRQQRIDAGRRSHKAEQAVIDARTEDLRLCVIARKSHPLDGALAAPTSTAREGCGPSVPFSKIPAGAQRPEQEGGSGGETPDMPTGRGRGNPHTQDAAPQRQFGRRSCLENRAVESASAEFLKQKGASHG